MRASLSWSLSFFRDKKSYACVGQSFETIMARYLSLCVSSTRPHHCHKVLTFEQNCLKTQKFKCSRPLCSQFLWEMWHFQLLVRIALQSLRFSLRGEARSLACVGASLPLPLCLFICSCIRFCRSISGASRIKVQTRTSLSLWTHKIDPCFC